MSACSEAGPPDDAGFPNVETISENNGLQRQTASSSGADAEVSETPDPGDIREDVVLPIGLRELVEPWTGDLDGMAERRVVRILTVYGVGKYFLDGSQERGITYDLFKMFEEELNKNLKRGHLKIHIVFLPVARDRLLPLLMAGRGDIVAATLTITPEREELVDFTNPVSKGINEILVTGPSAPEVKVLDDLAGQVITVRQSSSYRASLDMLNERFAEEGKPQIVLRDASELMEDEDLLEMVDAGMLPWVVIDNYKARLWDDVFESLVIREDLVFRTGGKIGFAVRKDSPQLVAALNDFMKTHKQGSFLGNVLINRYLKENKWAENALEQSDYQRFLDVVDLFENYGGQYGFDYLMVAAQGYQESRLDQNAKSPAGAIGIMQLLPSTAADPNVGIPDITTPDSNIHAGVKYLDFIRNRYFSDTGMDLFNRTLFSFAAYNAGPARIRGLRQKASEMGLDPDVWFDNVEVVAAREIGRETVQYVANIYKYYLAYSLSAFSQSQRAAERGEHGLENL
jgi:membrane-bound lytic murein transglycosylase MltF